MPQREVLAQLLQQCWLRHQQALLRSEQPIRQPSWPGHTDHLEGGRDDLQLRHLVEVVVALAAAWLARAAAFAGLVVGEPAQPRQSAAAEV